ncbi:hypothetical protein ACFXDE_16670 [Kitasatospora sp. NPDC059408]|uniref:hypothetical protein n=1 Tax=Kitasatospora sp. NPDC059408 TaxID=3346823 RepID=UPI0036BF16C3
MNLVWNTVDVNGIPFDPSWQYQLDNPGRFPDPRTLCQNKDLPTGCTDQRTFTDSYWVCRGGDYWGPPGHWNWSMPVTYRGQLSFEHRSSGVFDDDDYAFDMQTEGGAGYTQGNENGRGLHLEFSASETVDHFHTTWWRGFRNAAENSDAQAAKMVDGRWAIVTGLPGIDTAHSDLSNEIHPVWMMAILVEHTVPRDTWALFVRNWGNEGYCSEGQECLGATDYSFAFPWRSGADFAGFAAPEFLTNDQGCSGPYGLVPDDKSGVLVGFRFSPPEKHPRVNGTIQLLWNYPGVTPDRVPDNPWTPEIVVYPPKETRREREPFIGGIEAKMTPEQIATYKAHLPAAVPPVPDEITHERVEISRVPRHPPPPPAPRTLRVADPARAAEQQQRIQALRTAFGGNVPGLPQPPPAPGPQP